MPIQNARLGWRPDLPDHRDLRYSAVYRPATIAVPNSFDLTSKCPEVYDQLTLGSCVANGTGGLGQFLHIKEGIHKWIPSRLWIYWNARQLIGETAVDNGATIRDAMKVLAGQGMPPESLWWYDPQKFAVKPNKSVYDAALPHKVTQYLRLDNSKLEELIQCLADGFPFVCGFTVYDSFMTDEVARTGVVPLPLKSDTIVGGHAVMIVGYNYTKRIFVGRNSWGRGWGLHGYFHIPFDYLTNTDLSDDFWTARLIA